MELAVVLFFFFFGFDGRKKKKGRRKRIFWFTYCLCPPDIFVSGFSLSPNRKLKDSSLLPSLYRSSREIHQRKLQRLIFLTETPF